MSLHAVVKGKLKGNRQWKEAADLISVSATGASFTMPRHCEPGTLVSLTAPLAPYMRCYDYDEEFYRVWGLIQHCEPTTANDAASFHIGVAFIGKSCPNSYNADPMQHYRICGVDGDGIWKVTELKTPFKKRAHVRFWQTIELYLALVDTKDGSTGGERTVAENISRSGAAVLTSLNVGVGDRVKFISEPYDFSAVAIVRDAQPTEDHRTRLHLNFVGMTFPVEAFLKPNVLVEQI